MHPCLHPRLWELAGRGRTVPAALAIGQLALGLTQPLRTKDYEGGDRPGAAGGDARLRAPDGCPGGGGLVCASLQPANPFPWGLPSRHCR